jgi:hypothetical protein
LAPRHKTTPHKNQAIALLGNTIPTGAILVVIVVLKPFAIWVAASGFA